MRFLSIHLPFLSTDRVHRLEGSASERSREPLLLWENVKGAQVVTAANEAALRRKLHPGLSVVVARSMCPTVRLLEADPAADASLLGAIADWCRRFTPLAALDPPDGILLDVSGVAHLFGGLDGLLQEVEAALMAQGFFPVLSLAPSPAAAGAFARFGGPRFVADEAGLAKAVRALPVAALRVSGKSASQMRDAGLRTLCDLILRPRAPVTARFGPEVWLRIEAMLGLRRDPLSPRFEAPPYMSDRRFPEGLTHREGIVAVLESLCVELCATLARHGEGARRIEASFFRVDGAVRRLQVAAGRPSRDPRALGRLLNERLQAIGEDGLDTGNGFDLIRLSALAVEPLADEQETLRHTMEGPGESAGDFQDLVDRLGARFGTRRVQRIDFIDTHLPEHAVVLRPAAQGRAGGYPPPQAHPDGELAGEGLLPTRPSKLFEKPELIDSVVSVVPDGPPVRFRWRRTVHNIVAFEGPERIAAEWWKDAGPTRDYFRVEDAEGGRFWLFREGLYGPETLTPRWYVHGMFG